MVTNRKIIITLKDAVFTGGNDPVFLNATNTIYCDSVWTDMISSPELIYYRIDNSSLSLPIHNFLGSHLNENFKPDPDGN